MRIEKMRHTRKRLTCANRNDGLKNEIAIKKIIDRHVEEMNEKGWKLDHITSGDSFFHYEAYVHMTKENT